MIWSMRRCISRAFAVQPHLTAALEIAALTFGADAHAIQVPLVAIAQLLPWAAILMEAK